MSAIFKPMLACDADLEKLRFPILCSPKLDGVRAVVRDSVVYSRSNKPIPNKYVQACLSKYDALDGELIVGAPTSKSVYRDTVSHVMAHDKDDFDLKFYVFDHVSQPHRTYFERAKSIAGVSKQPFCVLHEQKLVTDSDTLFQYEEECLTLGYEGLILRSPDAPYKCGRSTVREGYLLKLKRFMDAEAEVIGFEERMHNGNEATTNELGRTRRSSHKAGKVGRGDLGALIVRSREGVEFNIGTGFTDSERRDVWDARDSYLGQLAKFKYFPVGVKEAPRHPVFLGWRMKEDMS